MDGDEKEGYNRERREGIKGCWGDAEGMREG